MSMRPGGEPATRPLHFIWMADCSGSMDVDGKIQSLNAAIKEALPHMRAVAQENRNARVPVRAIRFSSGAARSCSITARICSRIIWTTNAGTISRNRWRRWRGIRRRRTSGDSKISPGKTGLRPIAGAGLKRDRVLKSVYE